MESVHIEFQRVQSWLFAVPRLRAMVGANVLIGEALRAYLPELARRQTRWRLSAVEGNYPSAAAEDPLSEYTDVAKRDDPAADAQAGIVSRDGGHFEARFDSGADYFADEATTLLRRRLPGLRFRVSIDKTERSSSPIGLSTELPVLAPCTWTGHGLASEYVTQGDERALVSMDVARRHEAARRAARGQASDIVSLLLAKIAPPGIERPEDFEDLVKHGYLAVIHADGNAVGQSAAGKEEAGRSALFHRNRVLMRRAVGRAIERQYEDARSMSLIPLMLGGDDLLVISRADVALPFVSELCEVLAAYQDECQSDSSSFLLTLGVGVVFARPTVPIHRLHSIAEQLAASAKRRFRGLSQSERCSVVDWAVYSTTWVDDPEDVRRRDWILGGGARILSRRPMNVLGTGLDSLQGLLTAAELVKKGPRSQFRYLVEQLSRGQALSELAFAELSPEARSAINSAGITSVWQEVGDSKLITSVFDLIEVAEIDRLGRAGRVAEAQVVKDKAGEVEHAEA